MTVLVTGGFGLIGGRVATHLNATGHSVQLGTRCSRVAPSWLPQASVVATDWQSEQALGDICRGVDAVVHTAGMNAHDCAQDPTAAMNFNGRTTGRLVEAAALAGVSRFIYFSTAHVYGNPLAGEFCEDSPLANTHPYAASHSAGEAAVCEASRHGRLTGVVIRLTNAFGAPTDADANCWTLLTNDLCRQAVTTRALVLKTAGTQARDFLPISDVARAVEALLEAQTDLISPSVFNVASGQASTVLQMARLIQDRCGCVLGFVPELRINSTTVAPSSAAPHFSIDRMRAIGWTPAASATDEIDRLLLFCDRFWGAARA